MHVSTELVFKNYFYYIVFPLQFQLAKRMGFPNVKKLISFYLLTIYLWEMKEIQIWTVFYKKKKRAVECSSMTATLIADEVEKGIVSN